MPGYIRQNFKIEKLGTTEQAVDFAMAVLSASNEGILVTDGNLGIVFANDAFCKITGKTAGDFSEFDFVQWLKQLNGDSFDGWVATNREETHRDFNYKMESDGGLAYFNVHVSPLETFGSGLTVSVWRDVTAQEKQLDALKTIKAETEKANRDKDTFFSSMNHEVRTPMNGIIGMLELALDGEISRKQREYLALARCSAETLLNMMNNFFNYSRIEAGKLVISRIVFNLDAVIESIIASMEIGIREKGLKVFHSIDPDVPYMLLGDPDRLRQILANLVGNAVKFTEKGHIGVAVKNENDPSSFGQEESVLLGFSVTDTGIGIPESKHETIFESFVQADDLIGKCYGGAGLGLSMSKHIVQMMGGSMRMESEVGKGSVFHFTARFGKVAKDAKTEIGDFDIPEPDTGTEKRAEILLVEDNRELGHIFRELLENEEYGVTLAQNGKEALGLLENRKFEIIFMDIGLPEMDGFEVSKIIRQKHIDIPIIALTGSTSDRYEKEVLEARLDDFLRKPISRKQILDAVNNSLRKYRRKKAKSVLKTERVRHKTPEDGFSQYERISNEVNRLKSALNSDRFDLVENIAHELKSVSSDAGAYDLADEVFRLKLAARKGDMGKMVILAEKIEKVFGIFKNGLES